MPHRNLGRNSSQRRALLRNMTTSVLKYGQIETTEAKAKEVRRIVEKMITLGKAGNLHSYRQALAYLTEEDIAKKLFDEIAPKYEDRQGGYTRVIKAGYRRGDGTPMAIVQLV